MIDVTVKQNVGGVGDRRGRKSRRKTRRKHDAINLPKNLIDSDEGEEQFSSEDENDQYPLNDFYFKGTGHQITKDEVGCSYLKYVINEKNICVIEALKKLTAVVKKYTADLSKAQLNDKDLKARGPYRKKSDAHKKNQHYDGIVKRDSQKKDLTISTPHVNVRHVVFRNSTPTDRPDGIRNFSEGHELDSTDLHELVNAIQDVEFMDSFKKLTENEVEHVFNIFLNEPGNPMYTHETYLLSDQDQQTVVQPDTSYSHRFALCAPITSSPTVDQNNSSYESMSPSGSDFTSLGNPDAALFSPACTSTSSESDFELQPHMENCKIQPMTNVVVTATPLARCVSIKPKSVTKSEPFMKPVRCVNIKPGSFQKSESVMKPLGEAVSFVKTSATDRLVEFQNSSKFCIKHFTIQLVRVIMSAKGQTESEKIEEFSKSFMNTMKIKLGNRNKEGDIWQLSILAYMQFLLARVTEYRSVLLIRDECNHSLLYIAAIEQYKKPLVARYIAESMFKVGINPLSEIDEKGNTVLHLLAEQGDSHVHALSELLMACGACALNKELQTVLHTAVLSCKPHLTTVLTLLKMRVDPLQQDVRGKSALYYHMKQSVYRLPRLVEDLEVVRKMLQSLVSLNNESLVALNLLNFDPSISSDLKGVILEEISTYGVKGLRIN